MTPQQRLPAPLLETLSVVAERFDAALDPWWVIGSAAAALHGAAVGTIGDVDVVTGVADARRLLSAPDVLAVDAGDGPFRSEVFARLTGLPLPVDILGGFHVHGARLVIETRVACPVRDGVVFVPARDELLRIFRLFGRPKDLLRAAALESLPSAPT